MQRPSMAFRTRVPCSDAVHLLPRQTRSKLDKDLDACMGAEEEDGNTVAPDINLTIEDVRNNRNDMLAAMAE